MKMMKKIIAIYIISLLPSIAFCQDSTLNKTCENFTEIYSDSIQFNLLFEEYYSIVLLPIQDLSKEDQEKYLITLDSICPSVRKFRGNLPVSNVEPIDEKEEFQKFLKAKASKPWTPEEIESTALKCSLNSTMDDDYENLCMISAEELSKHIDFENFTNLTDYQQGRLMGKVATHIVNSRK